MTYEQVLAHSEGKTTLPRRAVIVTFDDSFSMHFEKVRPLLLKYGIPSIFFLITDCIDNQWMADSHRIGLCLDRLASSHPKSGVFKPVFY